MKRVLSVVLALILVCACSISAVAAPYAEAVDAEAVLLIDMETGEVLHAVSESKRVYPAGTTKLMTALVAYELCSDLDESFEITAEALYDISAGNDNEATAKSVVDATIAEFGRIDVLINNAQASASGVTIQDHTTEQFDLAIYSGLYATFYYMKACYPYLKETQGAIINFASGAGLFGNYGQCAYAAAKEGIRGLSRVAATEWAKDGINTNIICPIAWTAQLENFEKAYPEAFKANVKMPPAGHFGDPETEIGRVCVQLASPHFEYMNGETLTLEGGMGLRP